MANISEINVYFSIVDRDFAPENITEKTGITPTKIWHKGDLITQKGRIRKKNNGWRIDSKLEKSADLEAHILSVLQQLEPAWLEIVELAHHYAAEITCVIYYYEGSVPAIYFNQEIIKQIQELNAAIDVDLYILSQGMKQ